MNKEQILSALRSLAMSKGSYGRLLEAIEEDPSILDELEEQHFASTLDLVLYIEC